MAPTIDQEVAKQLLSTFIKLNNWLRYQFHHQNAAYGTHLTSAQFKTLFMLRRMQPCKMRDLSDHSYVSTSSLTIMLDKLTEENLVERFTIPEDRRVVMVRLTDRGHALLDEVEKGNLAHLAELLASLTEEDKERLARLLQEVNPLLEYPS